MTPHHPPHQGDYGDGHNPHSRVGSGGVNNGELFAFPAPALLASLTHGYSSPSSSASQSITGAPKSPGSAVVSNRLSDSGIFSEGGLSESMPFGGGAQHHPHHHQPIDARTRARTMSGGFSGFAREAALARAEATLARHSAESGEQNHDHRGRSSGSHGGGGRHSSASEGQLQQLQQRRVF